MQWQSSISAVLILTLIWLKISVTLSSNWSSETLSRFPCMSRLLHLLHRSYLFKSISNTEIWLFNFSVFWWSNEFFWQSASTMEFLILARLSATKSLKFSLKPDLMVTSWSLILLNYSWISSSRLLYQHLMISWNHFSYQKFPASSLHSLYYRFCNYSCNSDKKEYYLTKKVYSRW